FRRVAIAAILRGVFPRLEGPTHIDLGALAQILLRNAHEPIIENRDWNPVGMLLAVTVAVLVLLGNCEAKVADLAAILEAPNFRISAKIADEFARVEHYATSFHIFPAMISPIVEGETPNFSAILYRSWPPRNIARIVRTSSAESLRFPFRS